MNLLPKEIQAKIPAMYSQENNTDPLVVCKFFDPVGSWTWYVLEGEESEGTFVFFGYVVGDYPELGYFTLLDLKTAKDGLQGIRALPIERDMYFTPCTLSEIKRLHGIKE